MKLKELNIVVPVGYMIDKEKSTFEKIIFKPIEKPTTWEEFCKNFKIKPGEGYIDRYSGIELYSTPSERCNTDKNVLPNKEYATAFLALMQLISLRHQWINNWKPDWNDDQEKWCIGFNGDEKIIINRHCNPNPLSFPTCELATKFVDCFRALIMKAAPLFYK